MTITDKVKLILEASKCVDFKVFLFSYDKKDYILDISNEGIRMYNEEEYDSVERKRKKLSRYNKIKNEKILWIDTDGNEIGYGEKGRLKSIEMVEKEIKLNDRKHISNPGL